MRALQFKETGSLSHLELVELPTPEPDLGEALVRVHAAAINPSDAKNIMGMMTHTTLGERGWLVEISAGSERRVSFDLLDFYHRERRILGVNTFHLAAEACAAALEQMAVGFGSGALQPPPVEVFSLEEAFEAYQRVLEGTAQAKTVLVPAALK